MIFFIFEDAARLALEGGLLRQKVRAMDKDAIQFAYAEELRRNPNGSFKSWFGIKGI